MIYYIRDENQNLVGFRYRSYYYDSETGYYYLNSRYYDPNWGRFLNADNAIIQNNNLVGNNLFSYCMNNPTNRNDNSGNISVKSMIKIFNKIGSSMIRGLKSVGKTVKGTGKKIGKMTWY